MANTHVSTEQVGKLVELLSTLGIKSAMLNEGDEGPMLSLVMRDDDGVRGAQQSMGLPLPKSRETNGAVVLSSCGQVGDLFVFVDHVTAKVAA